MGNPKDFYELLNKRRSVRQFKKEVPPKEIIEKILEAALMAPSGKNRQNWRFIVVHGDKKDEYLKYSQKSWRNIAPILKNKLKPSLYDFTERFFYTLGGAPYIIFAYAHLLPGERYLTSVGSVYMAIENLNLACVQEGLGCCTMGAPLEIANEIHEFLGLLDWPEFQRGELELLCAVALGYPDHSPPQAPRQRDGRVTWI